MLPTSVDTDTCRFSDIERMRMVGVKKKYEVKSKIDFINSMFDELGMDGMEK